MYSSSIRTNSSTFVINVMIENVLSSSDWCILGTRIQNNQLA